MTPDSVTPLKVEEIYKTGLNHGVEKTGVVFKNASFEREKAQKVESAHGGGYEVWINMPQNP